MASCSPLGAVARGLAAGAVGTGVMTAAQTAYMKATGGESSSTPAEVGKRIIEGVLQREFPDERMETLNNVMHWSYGMSWGAVYGVVAGSRGPGSGVPFSLAVWGASLVQLPAMKLSPPVWEMGPKEIAPDLGFHAVYGMAVAAAYRLLS